MKSRVQATSRQARGYRRKGLIERLQNRVHELETELYAERRMRYDAQAGLASYMQEHGLGHRIGYDVRQDPNMRAFAPDDQS